MHVLVLQSNNEWQRAREPACNTVMVCCLFLWQLPWVTCAFVWRTNSRSYSRSHFKTCAYLRLFFLCRSKYTIVNSVASVWKYYRAFLTPFICITPMSFERVSCLFLVEMSNEKTCINLLWWLRFTADSQSGKVVKALHSYLVDWFRTSYTQKTLAWSWTEVELKLNACSTTLRNTCQF